MGLKRRLVSGCIVGLSIASAGWGADWIFSSYLGGSHIDAVSSDFSLRGGMTVDAQGNLYVVGGTRSGDFPVTNAYQSTHRWTSRYDDYLTKISPSGALVFSTYLRTPSLWQPWKPIWDGRTTWKRRRICRPHGRWIRPSPTAREPAA